MGILKAIGDFLFGKAPDIFDAKGKVRHKLPEKKWQDWDARIRTSPEYDWQQHTGQNLGQKPQGKKLSQ